MAPQGIGTLNKYYANSINIQSQKNDGSESRKNAVSKEVVSSLSNGKSTIGLAGHSTMNSIRTRVDSILGDIPAGTAGKLSFADIKSYREGLLEDFKTKVSAGLRDIGVDESIDFRLGGNPGTGGIQVYSSHPDKKKVEAFFNANPALINEFNTIETLSNLTRFADKKVSPAEMRHRLQIENIQYFLDESPDFNFTPLLMANSRNGITEFSGLSAVI